MEHVSTKGTVKTMEMRRQYLTSIGILVVVVVLAITFHARKVSALPVVGHTPPIFTLTNFQGQAMSIAQTSGKPMYINFFASWCPPCQLEAPDLEKMYTKYRGQIQFYGVDMTSSDSVAGAQHFVKEFGLQYPVLLDKKGDVSKLYNVAYLPTSFFVNSQGVIVYKTVGYMTLQTMQKQFAAIAGSAR